MRGSKQIRYFFQRFTWLDGQVNLRICSCIKTISIGCLCVFNLINIQAQKIEPPLVVLKGEAQGTTYSIKYYDEKSRNFKVEIDSILEDFDRCLSLYRPDSELSIFNRDGFKTFRHPYFLPVLQKSKEIYEITNGAFDPSILPLVEAYGFGANHAGSPSNADIKSLIKLVGFDQITFDSLKIKKNRQGVRLDFNGIAQGYSVDIIGRFLLNQQIDRFMVEIGGEILCKGNKNNSQPWVTGIENPTKPGILFCSVQLSDRAMTTAGNYRNHYEENGQVFNHIINPKTGAMEQSAILSVTVFAEDAITADGFDTAFFVMGLDETKKILNQRKDLDAYILYTDDQGKINAFETDGIKNLVKTL